MTLMETILGILFLFAQALVIPTVLVLFLLIFRLTVSYAELNILCFSINFACTVVIFFRYWLKSFKDLSQKWKSVLVNAVKYFLIYYGASVLINLLITHLDPEFTNANDNTIAEMIAESRLLISICVVLLVPPVEEILYRGIVFGRLYAKKPLLGYLVSIFLFAAIHVVSYIGTMPFSQLLLAFLQYLPAGYCLAKAYSKSGSLFAPILIHAAINLIAVLYM